MELLVLLYGSHINFSAARRILNGIADQVLKNLGHFTGVHQDCDPFLKVGNKIMLAGIFSVMGDYSSNDLVQVTCRFLDWQWQSSLDTADVEQVVNDAGQSLSLAVSFGEKHFFLSFAELTEVLVVEE